MSIKPIEIEFVTKDRVTPALGKMEQAAEAFGATTARASAGLSAHIKALEADLKSVKEELRKMQQQSDAHSGDGIDELRAELLACRKVIDEQAVALARLKDRHQEATSTAKSLVQEQRQLAQTLAHLKVEGQENTEEYARMRQRLAEITDAMGDVRQEAQALAHDDQHLNALSSGLTGLAGAATATTGVLSLFATEQEELAVIQTKLQSVMAITMGVQQAMDALNKSSAFSTVLLSKAQAALTAANTRLATAFGISTAAARALMATLTLGLSAAIAGAIHLYNRYADAQAQARARREEYVEIEAKSRAESIKARFELEHTIRKIKEFNGSKDEERRLVEELNRTKGETFGYYATLADWYKTLTDRSQSYVDTLYHEAKIRSVISKAVQADEEVIKIEAQPSSEYDSFGWLPGFLRRNSTADRLNNAKKDIALNEAKSKRDAYLDEAKRLQDELDAKRKESNIGGHIDPEESKRKEEEAKRKEEEARRKAQSERDKTKALAKSYADAGLRAKRELEDASVASIAHQYKRERAQIKLEYERRLEEITQWETHQLEVIAQLRQRGYSLDAGVEDKARLQAAALRVEAGVSYDRGISKSETDEAKAQSDALSSLLAKHQDYDAQRRQIEQDYTEYVRQLSELRSESNAQAIDAAIAQARKDADAAHRDVDEAEVASSEKTAAFLVRLYEEASDKSISQIKRIISETEALLAYLKTTPQGDLEAKNGLSSKLLGVIQNDPARLKSLQDALKQYKEALQHKSPLDNIQSEWTKGISSIKQGGAENIGKGIEHISSAATKALQPLKALGSSLGQMFGDSELSDMISSVVDGLSSVVSIGSGIGRIMAGDVLGGTQAVLSGIASIASMAHQAEARHQEAMRQVEAARLSYQREYNTLLLRQSLLFKEARSAFGEQDILKAANALKVYEQAQQALKQSIQGEAPRRGYGPLDDYIYNYYRQFYNRGVGALGRASIVDGHRKTGLFGWGAGEDVYKSILEVYPKLINAQGELDVSQLKVILSTRKMTDETREYLQGLVSQAELMEQAKEQFDSYLESSFGTLGSSMTSALVTAIREGRDALEVFSGDAAKIIERMSERMIYSLHFADRFKQLQTQLRDAYKAGGDERDVTARIRGLLRDFVSGISGSVDAAKRDMQILRDEAAREGFDLWGASSQVAQQGRSSAFVAMSQEQGTKLEGLFTAQAERLSGIGEHVEAIMPRLSSILEAIQQVARNTEPISIILDELRQMKRDGIKIQ